MRPVGAISRMMGIAIAVAAFVGATHVQAAPQQNEAVVRGVRGTANYSTDRGSNWKDLKVGTKLKQNSLIRTAPAALEAGVARWILPLRFSWLMMIR